MYGAGIRTNAKRLSNRERMRRADATVVEGQKLLLVLLAVLAQKGGEVVVTKATMEQVYLLRNPSFAVVPNTAGSEFTVRMLEGQVETPEIVDPVSVIVDDPLIETEAA